MQTVDVTPHDRRSRFTGKQITVIVLALSTTAVFAPVTVHAATGSNVNIVDPISSTSKARVNSSGQLWMTQVDPVSKLQARVDSSGRQLVADTRPVSSTALTMLNVSCGADGNGVPHIVNTSGFNKIRLWAHNPGSTSQAFIDVRPVINGTAQHPPIANYHLPYGSPTTVNVVLDAPPPQIDVRTTFCSPNFRLAVFGVR